MDIDDLSPELKAKALSCKDPQEILELAKSEGYELSDDELDDVSGGFWASDCNCYDPDDPYHNFDC